MEDRWSTKQNGRRTDGGRIDERRTGGVRWGVDEGQRMDVGQFDE